jgi:predicted ATPase
MLALNRLDRRDRITLVEQVAGGKALPGEVADQIVERTDGVPLFVEELTKSVLESGLLREEPDRYVLGGALPPLAIPTTLHASLLARLDRLSSVRLVAQTCAAIGREFSYALLRAVSRLADEELQAALARLVASELVFQRGTPPDAVYTFKHALVQDAAHGSLLRSTRQQLHAQIAEALETHPPSCWTLSRSFLPSITVRPGSLKNPSPSGARPVGGLLTARRWRKRPHIFKRGWTNWHCCRTPPNASNRSSNFAAPWARC